MDPNFPLGGFGRGSPMDTSRPPSGFRKSDTQSFSAGLYGVDCDFAGHKQRHEDYRMKPKDDRRGKATFEDSSRDNSIDGFGLGGEESGRRKHGSGDEQREYRRGCLSSSRSNRGQRVRFGGVHGGLFDSDQPSNDTSADEGVPQFGVMRDRRRGQKGKFRDERVKRSENYDSRPKQEDKREDRQPMRWNETFERPKFDERPIDNYQKRHESGIDYLHLHRDDQGSDRYQKYGDERKDDGRRYGRGNERGSRSFGLRSGGEDRSCYNCGEAGHISRDCPEPRKPPKVVTCFTCKKDGHMSRNCPEKYSSSETASGFNSASLLSTGADNGSDIVDYGTDNNKPKEPFDFSPIQFTEQSNDGQSDMPGYAAPQHEETAAAEENSILVDIGSVGDADAISATIESVTVDLDGGSEVKHEIVKVDQLFKKETLQKLLLHGCENYKDDVVCECKKKAGPFAECKCKKKVVVFVNRRVTAECIRILLAVYGVTVVTVHCAMEKHERERNLARFKVGRYPILIMMASEASLCKDALKEADWLVNLDLPINVDEYLVRIEMVRCEGKPLLVTSFYDELMDHPLAGDLVKILIDAGESVPEWLSEGMVGGGGLESVTVNGDGEED